MSGIIRATALRLAGAALSAMALTVFQAAVFALCVGAAWFALGSEMPPAPWFLFRFFLFIGWIVGALFGALVVNTDTRPAQSSPPMENKT